MYWGSICYSGIEFVILRDLFHANIWQEVYLKSKKLFVEWKVYFIILQRSMPMNLVPNSQGRFKKENGNAGNYFPTLSPEPENPNSRILVPHMQLPRFQCGSTKSCLQNQSLDNTVVLFWCTLLLLHWLQKFFAPAEGLPPGQFVLAMDRIQLKTTKPSFPFKLHVTVWTSVLFTRV